MLPHFRIAAFRLLIPSCVAADGIRFVSTRGPFRVGSGKSGTPLLRTHCANSRRAVNCWGVTLAPVNPGGSRLLHAARARWNDALFGSSDEPFTTPSMVNEPEAAGSGNPITPLARMHSANFTALLEAVLVPVPADPFPQPATTTTTSRPAKKNEGMRPDVVGVDSL